MKRMTRVPLGALIFAAACADSPTQPDAGSTALLVTSTANAGKIDICHYDQDLDRYFSKSIPASAWGDHQAHGDGMVGDPVPAPHPAGYVFDENCQPVEAGPVETIYAVAYIDVIDDGGGYDPDTDRLIAKLVEASGDGQPGNGDKVITGVHPTAFDAPWGIQSFNKTEHTVTWCSVVTSEKMICLNDDLGTRFDFVHGLEYESYSEYTISPFSGSQFADWWWDNVDGIATEPGSPSNPNQNLKLSKPEDSDEAFVDVEIRLPAQN